MTGRERLRRLRRRGPEHGSGGISMYLLLAALALFVVFGLVVDGGAKARAIDRASQIAYEGARAGLTAVSPGQQIDPGAVERAVDAYLAGQGATGHVTVEGTEVEVDATITAPTKVLRILGKDSWTITGHGSASLVYGG